MVEVRRSRTDVKALEAENSRLRRRLAEVDGRTEQLLSRVDALQDAVVQLQAENAKLVAENRVLRAENERLRADNARLIVENESLRTENAALSKRVAGLEARLGANSRNSSTPPSQDPPGTRKGRGRGKRGRRKRGGQKGHPGRNRPEVPPEQVDQFVDCRPEECAGCGNPLSGDDPDPTRHQVIDVPKPAVIVTEYRCHQLTCPHCGSKNRAPLPAGVSQSPFGPGLHALTAMLVGQFRQSKRMVTRLLLVLYGLELSPGSVSQMEKRVSAAVAKPVDDARAAIRQGDSPLHMDETGWRLEKQRAWLWVAATEHLAVFTIDRRRSSEVVEQILGESFDRPVTVDRWSAYGKLLRQICWAHLLRDFVAMAERFHSEWHGQRLARCALQVMHTYAAYDAGEIDRAEMQRQLKPVRWQTKKLLTWTAANAPGSKARAKARAILSIEPELWTFLDHEGVPVTNNYAERLLRHPVIWRRLSYGCDSQAGARFVERILTVATTLQLQQRDVLDYLTEAVTAHFSGQLAPSLRPVPAEG